MRVAGKIASGLGAAIAGGAAWFYARERMAETPACETIERDGPCCVRRYPQLIVAQTARRGERLAALKTGFGVLADYIFAESRNGPEIAMTAPVLAAREGGLWRIRFVMPAKWTRATLPAAGADVTIEEVPARTVAAIRFAGRPDDAGMIRRETELRSWMRARGLAAAETAEHAFYNSPLMPGPLRRNEVLIEVLNNQIG
jgi:hypothetical protein